eukprot:3258127-Rhodomonas_salina.1
MEGGREGGRGEGREGGRKEGREGASEESEGKGAREDGREGGRDGQGEGERETARSVLVLEGLMGFVLVAYPPYRSARRAYFGTNTGACIQCMLVLGYTAYAGTKTRRMRHLSALYIAYLPWLPTPTTTLPPATTRFRMPLHLSYAMPGTDLCRTMPSGPNDPDGYNQELGVTVDLKKAAEVVGKSEVLEGILGGGDVEFGLSLA